MKKVRGSTFEESAGLVYELPFLLFPSPHITTYISCRPFQRKGVIRDSNRYYQLSSPSLVRRHLFCLKNSAETS